ncbi:ROK family protein [Aminiphilus circumscriptus]|jgi:glucokinase|uniref:ROK family protein n=1 Tax=Aminiphilus circumscriptus TaxID=290732 RepID=UPI0004BADB59|nr:ROK family protein [Aminiphilus circumscriptus]
MIRHEGGLPDISGCAVGVDLGGHKIFAARVVDGVVEESLEEATAPGRALEDVTDQIRDLSDRLAPRNVPVGVGVPSMLDLEREHALKPPNFPGWAGVPLRRLLAEKLERFVVLENDANCYALGEGWGGAARGLSDYVVFTLGTGIGGGIVLGGRLFLGSSGMGGEIGHMVVGTFEQCGCGGVGHLEAVGGADPGERHARELGLVPDLRMLWGERNGRAAPVWERLLDSYARSVASVAHIFDPQAIILGGGLSRGEGFLDALRLRVEPYLALPFKGKVELRVSELGSLAAAVGAAAQALWVRAERGGAGA